MIDPKAPRVLVVVNSPSSGPRRLETWLLDAGIEVVPVHGEAGLPDGVDGFDGLVLLGGGLMPDDYVRAPWLRTERRLALEAIEQDLPTLGICLGAQLIADVAGGEVRAGYGPKECGSIPIHATAAGRADALLSALHGSAPMIENHEDMITRLPAAAVLLASSDAVENQAFVIGAHVRGVQFHPEASADDLESWDDAALRGEGYDPVALLDAARSADTENTRASRDLIDAFAREVHERSVLTARTALEALSAGALEGALEAADTSLLPAVLTAAFNADGVVAWRGLGEPRRDGVATDRGTVFRIASMSKSFLAAAALALVDEGKLDLARPITDYVSGPRFVFAGQEQHPTVGELLSNRSGMPEDNAWADRELGASLETMSTLAGDGFELSARPGELYQYSNLGMSLVGRAIEAVEGLPVEHVVRARFIDPLGLTCTRYSAGEYPESTDMAHGFRTFDGGESFVPEPFVGSGALACIGGIFSTVDDIASWATFLASAFGDDPLRPDLLSARSRREMQRAHTPTPIDERGHHQRLDASGYGFGLVAEHDRRFGRIVHHTGGLPGFTSHMRWHLASGIGVIVFGNSDAFRAELLATDALTRLLEATAARSESVRPWSATVAASERIDHLLCSGASLAEAGEMIASNLLIDVPDDVRRRRLDELLVSAGAIRQPQLPFTERRVRSEDAAHLRWRVQCERGALVCDARLVGLSEPLLQSLAIALDKSNDTELEGEYPR